MRLHYGRFLELRRGLWQRFEQNLHKARQHPRRLNYEDLEALTFDYRQVLHDQAQSRYRFPGTEADYLLRRLAVEGPRLLTRDPTSLGAGPVSFFTRRFPSTFREHLPLVAVVTAAFLTFGILGLALATYNPALGLSFVGPEAEAGLRSGRLWTEKLTTSIPPAVSSSSIASNNMTVSLTAWAGGALAGLYTLFILFINGLLLGSVIGLTLHYSMAGPLFEFVAAHGPLEITVILVSCAAGLVLARSMIVAEDRPRSEVLREGALDSLVLLGGSLPWLLVLGFVEGFVSPQPEIPVGLKAALGLSLEALFLLYALNPFTQRTRHG